MKTNELTSPIIAMIDGRFARIDINVTDLGSQEEELKKISASCPVDLANAFILNGEAVHIQAKKGYIIAWSELKKLPISTVYTMDKSGTSYPLFKKKVEASPPEYEASFDFEPEIASMRLFFASVLEWHRGDRLWFWSNSYLVAKAPKRKEIFRPPLSNIYSDARLCMGTYSNHGPVLIDVFAHSLAHLRSSKWNNDAMEGLDGDNIRALYSFKDNKQQKPPRDYKWWECRACAPVNLEYYGDLPLV